MANAVMEHTAGAAEGKVPAPRPVPTGDEWIWEDAVEEPEPAAPVIREPAVRDRSVREPVVREKSAGEPAVRDETVREEAVQDVAVPAQPVRDLAGPVVPVRARQFGEPIHRPRHQRRCGFTLPAMASSPRWARALVREAMREWGMAGASETVELLVSELATNAVRAGGPEVVVRVTAATDRFRVEVADAGAGEPRVTDPGPDAEDGHGMVVVSRLCADWGTYRLGTLGKVVWCEVVVGEPAAQ